MTRLIDADALLEALKAAIEELEAQGIFSTANLCKSALSDIESSEVVAWQHREYPEKIYHNLGAFSSEYGNVHEAQPLYTSPISKEWVGLSDERLVEITRAWSVDMERTPKKLAIAINDELKYLNAEKG